MRAYCEPGEMRFVLEVLVGWLVGRSVGQSVGWLAGWLLFVGFCLLVYCGCLLALFVCLLVGRSVGRSVARSVGWSTINLCGVVRCMCKIVAYGGVVKVLYLVE